MASSQDTSSQDTSSRDTSSQDTSGQDTSSRDTGGRDKRKNIPEDNYYCDTYKGGSRRIRRRSKMIRKVLLAVLAVILVLGLAAAAFFYYKFSSYYRLSTYVPEEETFEIRETIEAETYVNEAGEVVEETEAMLGESEAEGVSGEIDSAVEVIREAQKASR